ncbi:MAG: hypothetical protein ACSLFO_01935, partial [Acidimicrobiales bacterium]
AAAWELRVRTPEGSALYVDVEGFRRYLSDVEAADIERAAEAGVLHDHLAWAVALGETAAWTSAVRQSTVEPGTSYDPSLFLMASHLRASTSDRYRRKPSTST